MSEKPQPPAKPEPKQKTKLGVEIPVPKRGDFYQNLGKATKPDGQ
jgi:hypothetical protein